MKDILCIQFIFWIPYNVGVELATSEAEFRLHQRGAQALSQKHPQIIEQLAAETLWDDVDYHQDENLGPGPGGVLPPPSLSRWRQHSAAKLRRAILRAVLFKHARSARNAGPRPVTALPVRFEDVLVLVLEAVNVAYRISCPYIAWLRV